ncbi:MAG: hypothetical protein IAE91_07500 [Ignavibacteriaceae bacterium]|nr:hypothetical protein [Ignavibacteriaceae bacterium]
MSKFCFDNNFDRLREERKSTALIKLYKDRREDMEFSENLIKYIQISDQLNDLRNDLAHAGYRIGPRQFDNAINSIINLASEVKIMLKGDSLKLTPDQLELVRDILE